MNTETNETPPNGNGSTTATAAPPDATLEFVREKVTKKAVTADHPTWCPGCGDSPCSPPITKSSRNDSSITRRSSPSPGSVVHRASLFRERLRRAFHSRPRRPLASGISLARPDLHVFLFGGDGDGFSIGGNHLNHGARKNINMTYFIMDNFVYGLTKKQTSPTSPIGFKSKTDPTGAIDQPVNPMKQLICAGATFIARTHATQVNHMIQMIERAMDHQGFSVIECLSECVEFFPGAFDPATRARAVPSR
jgi:2-oxoglutarate ferredoxin oxidoreductase subunit beta